MEKLGQRSKMRHFALVDLRDVSIVEPSDNHTSIEMTNGMEISVPVRMNLEVWVDGGLLVLGVKTNEV